MRKNWPLIILLTVLPDVAIAWLYKAIVDGAAIDFWIALGVIFGIETIFSIRNAISGSLLFRFYGKRQLVKSMLDYLIRFQFPKPTIGEDALNYFARLADDVEQPAENRIFAATLLANVQQLESQSFFPAMRATAAYDAAVDAYAR
jgi:hypothetical protein